MTIDDTLLPGVILMELEVLEDYRGAFVEMYQSETFLKAGIDVVFCQDNCSRSYKDVLRGLHYQINRPQGHLVTVLSGSIFDVGLDLRRNSPTFGTYMTMVLSEQNRRQLWLPAGIAHGFCVLSDVSEIIYKCTDVYTPGDEGGVAWNDPELAISWPIADPVIAKKDNLLPPLAEIPARRLPQVDFK